MSGAPVPAFRPVESVRVLRYKAREHLYRSEAARDASDFATMERMRHLARLEERVADEIEAVDEPRGRVAP